MKKYRLTEECIEHSGKKLYRIQALFTMDKFEYGELVGWIEKEENLSQDGSCWVGGDAKVYGDARVVDNAWVKGNASVSNSALISGMSTVFGYATIGGSAKVGGMAKVYDYAVVLGDATVSENAVICGHAGIIENAEISGSARVYGCSVAQGRSKVGGYAKISGNSNLRNAVVCSEMHICNNACVESDLTDRKNIQENLIAQCGLVACDGKVTCYKVVRDDLSSLRDPSFKYKVGEWTEAENPRISDESCAPGLHFGAADYWMSHYKNGYLILIAEVNLDDIITIQEGKIRCKRAFIKGTAQLRRNIINEGD